MDVTSNGVHNAGSIVRNYSVTSHEQQNNQDWLHGSGCKEKPITNTINMINSQLVVYNSHHVHVRLMVEGLYLAAMNSCTYTTASL